MMLMNPDLLMFILKSPVRAGRDDLVVSLVFGAAHLGIFNAALAKHQAAQSGRSACSLRSVLPIFPVAG